MRTLTPADGICPATEDHVHAIEVRPARTVYVSGTMGLRPDGVPGRDLNEQLRLIWDAIRRILAEADMTVADIVRATSCLGDAAAHAQATQDARRAAAACRRPRWSPRRRRPTGRWGSR